MAKNIVRLTEQDLFKLIKESVSMILKEDYNIVERNETEDAIHNIMNGEVWDECVIRPSESDYGYVLVNGADGVEYYIKVYGDGEMITPSEEDHIGGSIETDYQGWPAEYDEKINKIELFKEAPTSGEIQIPYVPNEQFEEWLNQYVKFDFDGYEESNDEYLWDED